MEVRNERETAEWVDRQIGVLFEPADWEPDIEVGWNYLRVRQSESATRKRLSLWMLAGATAAILLIASIPPSRAYAQRCAEACVAETSRLSEFVLAKLRPDESKLSLQHAERREAPDFALTDAGGRTIRLSEFRGRVVVLNFWATWCVPCRTEIPWFVEFQRQYAAQGFSVVGVSVDEDGWTEVRPFLSKHGVNYPVAVGGEEIAAAYGGLEFLPTTLILDRNGRVAATHVGLVSRSDYERDIRAVLAESR